MGIKRITDHDVRRIEDMILADVGLTDSELSRAFKVSGTTISTIRKRLIEATHDKN